jgi:predicted aldo/keto reductase-like oxidoreductase
VLDLRYRELGNTGIKVSEVGLGAEWLEKLGKDEVKAVIDRCDEYGINILDCWMSEPNVRSNIGAALKGRRERWIIQGHIGSTWQNGQYERSRDIPKVKAAFDDILARMQTDYMDLGMIHFVDEVAEYKRIMSGEFIEFVLGLKRDKVIRHIGLSTHNPDVAKLAAESGIVEMLLFSINPAFDMLPATEDIDKYFADTYDESLSGIAPEREELYKICERRGVGINVMKGFAGGRLLDASASPFGVALTPAQCIHYCLTRPAVASVLAGCSTPEQVDAAAAYETAGEAEKDYATVLAGAPKHTYTGGCTYCGHCAPCPSGIDIATVNKLCDLAEMQETVPSSLRAHYRALSANADNCIACGACEKRCPFGVRVIEHMEKAKNMFK